MKTELKTKSVSLLLVTIMLCSIFTGAVTADTNKSAANTTLALGNPRSCIGCAGYEPWYYYAGGIVNTANGNLYLAEEKDISIKARGFDIEIIRSYNSHNSGKHGPFGFGWTFNYNIYLVKNDDGSVTFFDEDGSVYTFSPAGGNNYTAPPGKHSKLTKNPDGSFTLWFTDGSKYNFGSNGEINNITDKNDNHLNFEYSLLGRLTRISDDSGLYLNLNYNLRGRISSVSDTLGREIRYEYNVNDLTKVTDAMGNSLLYFYYDNHKIRSMVDEMDNTLLFSYGTVSGVDRVSEIKGTVYDRQTGLYSNSITFYSFEYDTINKLVDVIDSNGRTISVRYNEAGNPIKITDLLGNTISINWKNHTQIGITDKNGNTFLYEYDAYGNLIDSTDHMGYSRYYRWTTINTDDKYISLLSNITNKKGYTTEYEYDRQGNLILVTDAHGNATTRAYDAFGYVTLLTERGGTQTVYFHDSHGNLINAADSTGNGTKFSYDLAGRLLSITDANNHSIEYEYNSNNNLIKIIENDQIETEYDYDALGKLVSVNDANGMQTEYKRYKGKTEIIEPLNTRTTHYYDYNGNLITVTNARGYNTSLEHDALGRVTAAYDNHGNIERFSYDALGNLIRYTDMNDTITTYAYDSLSRLIHVKYPSSDNIFYNWTETGKIISQQNRDSKITYQYDALDRLVSVLFDYGAFNRTISYHYGADDNPIAMMDPEGNITRYEYDELNRLVRIVDPSAGDIAFEYDEGSRRTVITYPNNASISYSYDRTDRISNIVNLKSNGEVISNYSYTYDTLGNRLSVNESGDITSYSYDALCQLIQATYPNADVARYGYDKNGNRLTMVNRTTSISYTYDADDRLLSDGTADYSYDANGNLIRKTDGSDITTYVYGDENRLIKAVLPDGTDAAYRYFPNGFRMSKTVDSNTTYYFYDREDILMELDANGIKLARYTHGQGIDDPLAIVRDGVRGYYLRDALGSVTSIINTDEKLLAEYQYDAYGVIKKITENLENPYTFTGREYDVETGLYYYRARYYSPEIGRFTTRDPIPTLELSPYVYVENNPVNYIDPSGESFLIIAGFIAVVGYAVCLVYGAASAINTYQEAFEQAIQSGRRRGELLDRLAEGDITPERLEALNTLVQDNLQNAAGAAWALYTSIPGTLKTGTLPTSVAGVIAGAGGSLMTSILSDGYVPDIDVIEERLGELTDEQREQFDRLHQALEDGDRRAVVGAIIDIDRKNYHPDDNHDVSIFSYSHSKTCTSKTGTFNYKSEEIAILANGFYEEFSDLLTELGESTTFVDVYTPLEELNGYRILIIPSGGFSGISSLSSFKSKLENYVKDGGTLIVYSQNHGYEFEAVPGDLSGYGWTEDQACHHRSVAINTYHPMLSGQDSVTLDVVVDGYFTTYPEDATILLTRTKNGMPAMLMYEYGNGTGTVIATTIYTDWAYGHHQATVDGKTLLRDMISWAKERKDMPGYGSGDTIDIPINVTSYIDLTSEKVKFEVIADNEVIDTVEVTTSVPPYETKTVDFTYTAPSKFGILHIDYLLVNDSYGEVQQVHDAQKFEVSKYAENPDGFVYRGKELQIWATSSDDYVAKGSEVVFTVYVRNNGDDSLKGNIGIYGHEQGGAWWAYYDNISNITIPPHSEDSFTYTHKMEHSTAVYFGLFDHPVDHNALSMRGFSQKAIAKCERGVWTFSPSVDIGVETDEEEYTLGEDVHVSLNLTNNQKVNHNATVTVRTLDSVNKKIYEESFDANLSAYESTNKTLSFSIPKDSSHGTCIVTAEAFENEEKIGSNSTYFELPKTYRIRVDYDKTNKVYGIRQNLSLSLNITNTGSSVWSSWVNTTIPSLSFSDSKFLSFNPNENREIEYKNLAVPADLTPGKHGVFVHLSYGSTTKKDNFFIPCSDLRIEAGKKNNAGENFSFNISNVGGVDTAFNCSFEFRDWKRGKMIYEDVVEDTVLSLNSKTISFEIPNQSVNGLYYLIVSCKDIKTGKETELAAKCEVSGLKADLISDTERRVYFKNENVSILTNITNQNGDIVSGTLNLKIVRVSMPNSTGQALARATAKLSGYKYKLEEQNIVRHNSSHNRSHNSSTPQSPSPPPTNFLPGLSPYNLIATARAASPPANLTPEPEPLPEDEFNESYGNESVIEEPSPSPPANLTPTPEHEPEPETGGLPIEELSPTPSINVTPTPEPQNETEELPTLAVKSSSMEIGNETLWKDEVKILNENLIVNSTGKLTLINTTVIMNCSSDGQYHIEVQNGGEMHIFDSEITASDSRFEYYFQVKSGAKFEMHDSELHECGYTWGTNGDHAGLWINTDNVIIENNLMTNNYCGIMLHQSNNSHLTNNTANSNYYGIYLESSNNNTLTSNTANSNKHYHGIYLSSSNNNALTSNTANSNERYGIYLEYSNSNTLTSNFANSNEHYGGDYGHGIYLYSSSNNTLTSNTANSNRKYGIVLSSSNNNTLTNNTANLNHDHGIYLYSSNNNSLTINTASSNKYYHGIYLSSSNNNTLTSNTANSNDDHGIYLSSSSNNVLTNNTAKENDVYDLFIHTTSVSHCNNRIDNTTGSGDRPIKYFNSSVNLSDEHLSELILCNADHSDINNVTLEGSSAKKNNGVLLVRTDFSNLTNINSSGNHHGIYLGSSHNNTLTSNIMTENSQSGIYLYDSCNNSTIKNNSVHSNSRDGIYLNVHSNNNIIENNTISSNSNGISLCGSCNNNAIGNNTIESNGNGISFSDASNNNAIENNVIKNNKYAGIDLRKSHNNRIISNNLTSNQGHGIRLYESGSNTLKGNNVEKSKEKGIALSKSWSNKIISNWIRSNNGRGIHIEGSDNNNVTGNNVSFNSYYGIEFSGNNHVLADNIVNSNGWSGIKIVASNSILRNNTINSNSGWGIYMHAASYNTLLNNSINDNKRNFGVGTSHHDWDKHFNHSIDTSNTVNGKPIYYIVNEKDKIYDETTNAGYFAAVFCENITIKNLNNLTNNSEAVLFRKTHHSHIVNIFGMLNSYGINLMHSDNNTVSNSNLSTNSEHGLYMWYSSGDEIRNCNISSNDKHGVYIYSSNNNRMDSCIISSNEEHGVYINDHSNNNRIDNCVISSNKERGVYINDHSNSNDILNSSITSNGRSGVTIDGWTYNCELNNNSISLNNDYGIYIRAGGSNKIFNNTVNSKKEGIYFRDGTNNILINNNVTSDSYPLYFSNVDSVAQDIDTTNTLNDFKTIALSGVNNVTVTNFSLVMPEKIKVTNFGIINLANCKNVSIENVTIVNHSANGIFVYKSSDNVIANCTLNSNDRGIYLYKSEPCDILNNTLNNNRIGVRYNSEDLYHCNIKGNEMNSNLEHGIYIVGCCGSSGETSISDNIMSYNGKWGIYISRTGGNVLINNNTLNSNEDGIYVSQAVYEATNFHVSNNTITNNDNYGIYFDGAKNNDFSIASNIIKANNYGLYGKGHLDANLIYDNFFENTINAYDDGQNTWNITKTFAENGNIIGGPWLGGNYWSDYEGEDEDGDEIGDTLLPYNCSGRIKEGGDYLPLVMPLPPKAVLWEKNITINLAEGETENIVSEVPASVFKDVTGKQKLSTTFYSNTMQIINISDPFFYITPKNTSLTMETEKRVYKPNETVLIYGEVKNHASTPADCNLSINKDGAEIFSDSFTLGADGTRYYATNTTADASFNLEGTVDGVVVLDSLSVESPEINASIIAPDVVGIKDFDIGVLIENIGNITADLNVSLDGKRWNITVPEGESQLLETSMNTSRNMTITVIISGDVTETIQKEIICGENAKINITPEPTYLEGEAEIPFTINNTGVLDSEFNATFSISSPEEQNITKHFFVPKGENITDCVSFNLTKGAHLLRYTSPFETVNTTINVLSPPEFILTSIHPAELNFTIGENVTLVFTVKNVGGSEGEAALKLSMIDFEDTNRTWIRAGSEENISFNFSIPDDLEEKSYKGIYVLAGTRSEFSFFVQGANISVDASLDKSMYAEGDTAVLTLELTNECKLDLDLYSRVKFNEYDSVQNFTLSGSGTETLVFYLPANFSGDNKVLYTVYMDSGRALYINSIYIYEELPDAPLRLFTDKDVYNMGEEVTIHIVDVTGTDMLNLTAPNFSYNDTISDPTTLEFTLPELRSGTYYIEYSFGNFSSTHPFDVRGYSARILEASLDKEEYISGNEMKLELNIEANRDVSGLLKTWIYDPEENLIDEFAMNKRLIAGENKIELCRTLSTDKSGIHAIVYGFSAELSGDSSTTLVSGAEYFDAESVGLCGDVAPYPDCNGIVDMGDVILLLNNVSYPEDPRYALCNYWAGDCRCTGIRDMGDVILLLNYVSYPEDPRYVLDCC